MIQQLKPLLPIASAVCSYPIPASDAVAIARRNSPGPRTGEVRSAVYVSLTVPAPRAAVKPHSNSPVVVVNCIPVTGTRNTLLGGNSPYHRISIVNPLELMLDFRTLGNYL